MGHPANAALAVLLQAIPKALVEEVLKESRVRKERVRKLPRSLTLWLVVGMGLYRQLSIENVLLRVASWLPEAPWDPAKVPHPSSVAEARDRLGWETVRTLFRRFAKHLQERTAAATSWRGHEVFTLDGTCFMAPDSRDNDRVFGRASVSRGGTSAFPQIRALMLVGLFTHVISEVVMGPYKASEMALGQYLLDRLRAGTIVLMDRAFYGFVWPSEFMKRSVHFVIRMKFGKRSLVYRKVRRLGQGDWIAEAQRPLKYKGSDLPERLRLRMIECARPGFRPVFVITSMLDPEAYPAAEIAALYRDRWEAELSYRELKSHLAREKVSFRSKTHARVLQEAYGLFVAYNCVRALMCDAAAKKKVRPINLSFTDCLNRLRLGLEVHASVEGVVEAMSWCELPPRRKGRRCERAVKIKFSSYSRKRNDRPAVPNPKINDARRGYVRARRGGASARAS